MGLIVNTNCILLVKGESCYGCKPAEISNMKNKIKVLVSRQMPNGQSTIQEFVLWFKYLIEN